MENQILKLLGSANYAQANVPELLHQLGWSRNRQQELQRELRRLELAGRIARIKGNRYILPQEADLIPGRDIRINRAGKGFLHASDDTTIKEIAIPENATLTALHEDHVLVRRDRPEHKNTGTVITRAQTAPDKNCRHFAEKAAAFFYVVPDDPRIPHDIYVPEPRDVGRPAYIGDKVVVELREWKSRNANPEGEIIEVLGAPDEEGVDMLSVLRQYNLPLHFPKNVLAEARVAIGSDVNAARTARTRGLPEPPGRDDRSR